MGIISKVDRKNIFSGDLKRYEEDNWNYAGLDQTNLYL